jgi:hypothetical protein
MQRPVNDPPHQAILDNFTWDGFQLIRSDGVRRKSKNPSYRRTIMVPGYGQKLEHRVLWIYFNGPIPFGYEIDHKDGNQLNNDLGNLRLATSSEQKMNRGCQANNRAGLRGAYYHACHPNKKWRTQIKVGGKLIFLGYFDTAEEASEAHLAAHKKHFGEFSNERVRKRHEAYA